MRQQEVVEDSLFRDIENHNLMVLKHVHRVGISLQPIRINCIHYGMSADMAQTLLSLGDQW